MTTAQWIAQGFGVIAIVSSLIIYQQKKRKKILLFKSVQDVSWCVHYILLSAFSAAATSGLCVFRAIVFYRTDKKMGKSVLWLPFFLLLYAVSAVLTWKNAFSILPAISSSFSTVAFWMKNPRHTKLIAIVASLCTLVYNIMQAHSVAVYVGVSFTVTSALISLLSPLWKKEEKNATN